ncbi:MAG: putative lipid II flippase FtsW [Candidatus Howiella sp.]
MARERAAGSGEKEKKFRLLQSGRIDLTFFSLVIIILTIGLVMLFSASYAYAYVRYDDSYLFIRKQFILAVVGVIAMLVISKIDYHILRKLAWPVYILSVILLIIVLILPPMREGFDYKRWIYIGSFQFQPSEIAKFAIVLLFAHLISINYKQMEKFTFGVLFFGILLMVVCGLVVVETHLSATLLIFAIGICLMIVGGIKMKYVALGLLGGVGLGVIAILTGIVDYGSSRIQYWLDPWAAPKAEGYQVIQSLLSIGSGGLFGRGIGQSRQKYLWVPEPHNDFIFAIVAEELGLFGSLIVVLLFCMLVWRGFVIAMRSPDKFGALLAVGLTFQVGVQAALNIMVVTNTIPNTGISLPFFSYGGTALVILLAEMGVVLSVSRRSNLIKT